LIACAREADFSPLWPHTRKRKPHINLAPIDTGDSSFDGTHRLESQAVTYGQVFSRPMADFIQNRMADRFSAAQGGSIPRADFVLIIAEMRASGIDVDLWYRAKSIAIMFGPMAEARLLGKPFDEVWNEYSSEGDVTDVVQYGLMCGMTTEQISAACDENAQFAERAMEPPVVWTAILALADRLVPGRRSGKVAAEIVTRVLGLDRHGP
jgi:hypothetical protein